VELLLCTTAQCVVRLLKRLGRLDEDAYPQDTLQALQMASFQRRLLFPATAASSPVSMISSRPARPPASP